MNSLRVGKRYAGEAITLTMGDQDYVIGYYNAYEAQTSPRAMDMMYSLAFLYKKLGRYAEAKKEWELIIETLVSDYEMTEEHNDVEWAKCEIKQLKSCLEN